MARKMYSGEAEQSVIGAILLQNAVIDSVNSIVEPNDFNETAHRLLYSAILELSIAGKGVDIVSLSDILDEKGISDQCGGLAYIAELARNTPSARNAEMYAKIVADHAKSRRFVQALEGAKLRFVESDIAAEEFVEEAQRDILASVGESSNDEDSQSVADLLPDLVSDVDRRFNSDDSISGYRTGLNTLDEEMNGLETALTVIAGRPGMGKSAFANRLVLGVAQNHKDGCCLIYSMEMTKREVMQRLVAAAGFCPLQAVLRPKTHMEREGQNNWDKLAAGVSRLKELNIQISDRTSLTVPQIAGNARKWRQKYGKVNVIMVDYIQLMNGVGNFGPNNRVAEISQITRDLKNLSKEFDCPVLALSQLSRQLEQRPNKRPVKSDLRESGSIEQDANNILFLYRDEVYHPNTEAKGTIEVIRGKMRNGPEGTTMLTCRLDMMQFFDFNPEDAARIQQAQQQQSKPMASMASF